MVYPDHPGAPAFSDAGTTHRASLHVVEGEPALRAVDPGGLEVLACDHAQFAARLRKENHALKRALTDPHLFAYTLGGAEVGRLFEAARHTLES